MTTTTVELDDSLAAALGTEAAQPWRQIETCRADGVALADDQSAESGEVVR